MKKRIAALLCVLLLGWGGALAEDAVSSATLNIHALPPAREGGNTSLLVAYFSTDDTIRAAALTLADALGADVFEILPEIPYTARDLNYHDSSTRATREQRDSAARPAIAAMPAALDRYDTVLLGYPIWWGQAPKIVYTFLESGDFAGKTIIPFCTSASSGVGSSDTSLHAAADAALWQRAVRIGTGETAEDVRAWALGLGLAGEEENVFYLRIGDVTWTADWADNPSARAMRALLDQGDLTLTLQDYGHFEKVGQLPKTLPRSDAPITTVPGDVILYLGRSITVYYAQNTWDLTRLGHIRDVSEEELKATLGSGDVTVTFSIKP